MTYARLVFIAHALPYLSLMGLFPVNPFIRRAVWAYAMLDSLDKPISDPALLLPGARAYRALDAVLCHFFIFFGYRSCVHKAS
jgi:hypothetical protein